LGCFGQLDGGNKNLLPTIINGLPDIEVTGPVGEGSIEVSKISVGTSVTTPSGGSGSLFRNISISGSIERGRAPSNPFGSYISIPKLWTSAARGRTATFMPADIKAIMMPFANHRVSASVSNATFICSNVPRNPWMIFHCSWFSALGCNWDSSFVRAKSACAARSAAIAALSSKYALRNSMSPSRPSASSTRLFDIRRNSVWMRPSQMPNPTSKIIPKATAASAMAESLKNKLYGGFAQAITKSAATPRTTIPAQNIPHRSHDVEAASSWLAAAFILPFRRSHAGNGSLRAFLMGIGFGALMFLILYTAGVFVL